MQNIGKPDKKKDKSKQKKNTTPKRRALHFRASGAPNSVQNLPEKCAPSHIHTRTQSIDRHCQTVGFSLQYTFK